MKKKLVILLIICIQFSCENETNKMITLPNNEKISLETVAELDQKFNLIFNQYEGFKGEYNDAYLNKFTVLFQDNDLQNDIGFKILSDSEIDNLKNQKITGIRFNKIPSSKIKTEELLSYLMRKYPNSKIKEAIPSRQNIDKEWELKDKSSNEILLIIQYVKMGISGVFITVKK